MVQKSLTLNNLSLLVVYDNIGLKGLNAGVIYVQLHVTSENSCIHKPFNQLCKNIIFLKDKRILFCKCKS